MDTVLNNIKHAKWQVLAGMIACLAMVFLDQSVVPVALPAIQSQLTMSELGLQWVLNSYLVIIAVLIIPAGKLADNYGHKKFFMGGMIFFFIASCLCAVASNGILLIAGRVLQGLGAAMMMPASAAILTGIVPPQERGKMMGIYIAVASIFLAIGPMIGGLVTQYLGWRWVFWLNLPFIAFSLFIINSATSTVQSAAHIQGQKVDWRGLTWLALSITPLVIALLQSSVLGWASPILWTLVFTSIISIILFVKAEKHRTAPLLDLDMLSARPVSASIAIVVLTQYAIISIAFWPTFLQTELGLTAGQAGLGLIPVTLPIMFISPIAGQLMDKHGPSRPIILGTLCLISGSLWLAATAGMGSYLMMLPGFFIFGCGPSFLLASMMAFLFGVVEPRKRGTIAGFTSFFRQLGSALGLALTSAIISNAYAFRQDAVFAFSCSTIAIAVLSLLMLFLLRHLPKGASHVTE